MAISLLFSFKYSEEGQVSAKQFKISIKRDVSPSAGCVTGYLSINDNLPVCHTLELPWLFNTKNVSCVPPGSYSGTIRADGDRGWRIQLEGVPGRKYIQIHIGNYPRQIKGCILVGESVDYKGCVINNSGVAMKQLSTEFNKEKFFGGINACPEIVVVIE